VRRDLGKAGVVGGFEIKERGGGIALAMSTTRDAELGPAGRPRSKSPPHFNPQTKK
jgi:hypothetical protein